MSAVPVLFSMKTGRLLISFRLAKKKQTKRTTNSDELKRTHPNGVRSVRISSLFRFCICHLSNYGIHNMKHRARTKRTHHTSPCPPCTSFRWRLTAKIILYIYIRHKPPPITRCPAQVEYRVK